MCRLFYTDTTVSDSGSKISGILTADKGLFLFYRGKHIF